MFYLDFNGFMFCFLHQSTEKEEEKCRPLDDTSVQNMLVHLKYLSDVR